MNLTELEKEKAIKEQKGETAESNIDLKSLVDRIALHEKHPELDDQYNRALLKLFLREVIFQLQCRVEKEKKWWKFWETTTERSLKECQEIINNRASKNTDFLREIRQKKSLLDHASKYHLQQILENVGFRDTFEECTVFTQRIPETRIFRTAEALKAKAKSRDERLLSYAGGQDKINEFIDDFGFERNIPNYSALPNENKRQWEKLALLAVAPAIGTPAARISALSESAVPVDVLSKTVARSIGQVYGVVFEQGDYEKFNMPLFLNQILEKCGFWGTWSSQYKTIKKIITLTQENPPLSGAKIARALRYIDQLSPSFFDSRAQESLRTLFLNLREETGMAIINKSLRSNSKGEEEHTEIAQTLKVFSGYQKDLVTAYDVDKVASIPENDDEYDARLDFLSVPKNAQEIEKLVYLIIHEKLPGFLAEYKDSAPLLINQYQLMPNYSLLRVLSDHSNNNFSALKKNRQLYYLVLLFLVLLHYSTPFSGERRQLVNNLCRLLSGECPVAMTGSFSWLNHYIPNPLPSLVGRTETYSTLKSWITAQFSTVSHLDEDIDEPLTSYRSSIGSSSFFHHLTPSIARPSMDIVDVSQLLPECIAIHDDFPAEQKEFKQRVQTIKQSIINSGPASAKDSIEVPLNTLLNTSEILDRRVIILKVLLDWYIAFRGTQDYVNRPGQSALIRQCRLVTTQLGRSANEMIELNELYQCEEILPVDSSGAKLLRAIKKLFPSRQVNNPYTLYAAKMFGYAKAIDSRSDKHKQILLHLSRNINLYPQTNYWSIAILTLHQWLHDQEYTIEEDKIDKKVAEILMNNTEDNDLFPVQLKLIMKDSGFFDKISEACIPKTINFSCSQPILEETSVEEIPEIDPTAQAFLDERRLDAWEKAKNITPKNVPLDDFASQETKTFLRPFARGHLEQLPHAIELYYLLSWYNTQKTSEDLSSLIENLKMVITNPSGIAEFNLALLCFEQQLKEGPLFDLLCPKSTLSFYGSQQSWREKIVNECNQYSLNYGAPKNLDS